MSSVRLLPEAPAGDHYFTATTTNTKNRKLEEIRYSSSSNATLVSGAKAQCHSTMVLILMQANTRLRRIVVLLLEDYY